MKTRLELSQVIQTGSTLKMNTGDSITLVLPNGKKVEVTVRDVSIVSVGGSILYSSEDPE